MEGEKKGEKKRRRDEEMRVEQKGRKSVSLRDLRLTRALK